jgi:hypothetical protein
MLDVGQNIRLFFVQPAHGEFLVIVRDVNDVVERRDGLEDAYVVEPVIAYP